VKRFLTTIAAFIFIPVLLLVAVYIITDPYRTIRPFSLEDFDETNRDYVSSELWLMNNPVQHYDSYLFGSSRLGGINTYHWLKYLPEGSSHFLFQGWGETITGMEQKISYINGAGLPIKNAILLLDYPGAFRKDQNLITVTSIKHPTFAGRPKLIHESILFWFFLQKPSQWWRAVIQWKNPRKPEFDFDPISNDTNRNNKYSDLDTPPGKDSLKKCSETNRESFIMENSCKTDSDLRIGNAMINEVFEGQLRHIRSIFDAQGTDYRIILSPDYCYTNLKLNEADLKKLRDIFGEDNVFDFTGRNYMTEDYNNYSDPEHFGLWVGWHMIEEIYNQEQHKSQY